MSTSPCCLANATAGSYGADDETSVLVVEHAWNEATTRAGGHEIALTLTGPPEALDVDSEPEHVKRLYGLDQPKSTHFARQCLTARRLVERQLQGRAGDPRRRQGGSDQPVDPGDRSGRCART